MKNEEFNKIEKILSKADSNAGGPLGIDDLGCIDLSNILEIPNKKDLLIHVKYFPEDDRYGFSVYNKEDRK